MEKRKDWSKCARMEKKRENSKKGERTTGPGKKRFCERSRNQRGKHEDLLNLFSKVRPEHGLSVEARCDGEQAVSPG